MKLKEIEDRIKSGIVIHCKTELEAELLLDCLRERGVQWNSGQDLSVTHYEEHKESTCYSIHNNRMNFSHYQFYRQQGYDITEFSDLISLDLFGIRVIWMQAKYCMAHTCDTCRIADVALEKEVDCIDFRKKHPEKVLEIITDSEVKEVKTEWVDTCHIFKKDPDGFYKLVSEEELIAPALGGNVEKECEQILKRFCEEHEGTFTAVHHRFCRVKE